MVCKPEKDLIWITAKFRLQTLPLIRPPWLKAHLLETIKNHPVIAPPDIKPSLTFPVFSSTLVEPCSSSNTKLGKKIPVIRHPRI